MVDPYSTLGVNRDASEAEIKSAFRKMAKKYHPDQNAGNAKAQENFARVSSAYEIIGDKDKRGQFDRGEIDGDGKEKFQGFAGGNPFGGTPRGRSSFNQGGGADFSAEDILGEIFGARAGRSSNPFSGMGAGMGGMGGGMDDTMHSARPGAGQQRTAERPKGQDAEASIMLALEDIVSGEKVRVSLPTGKTLAISIPNGVQDGQVIRLKGQGYKAGLGGKAGDALITVRFAAHPVYKIDGVNIRIDLPIALYEAVLGAKVKVPTLSGIVALTIPKNANSGQTFRLKKRGLPQKNGEKGDILVSLKIILPEGGDADLETMMKVWQEKRSYDVRGPEYD